MHVQNVNKRPNILHLSTNQGLYPKTLSNQVKDVKFLVQHILDQYCNTGLVPSFCFNNLTLHASLIHYFDQTMLTAKIKVCKILFIGSPSTGKTSIIKRYVKNSFAPSYRQISSTKLDICAIHHIIRLSYFTFRQR